MSKSNLQTALIPFDDLLTRYNLCRSELESLLLTLQLETEQIEEKSYVTPLQLDLLDSLKTQFSSHETLTEFIDNLPDAAFLYRCSSCGQLLLSGELLFGEKLLHSCSLTRLKKRLPLNSDLPEGELLTPSGKYELLASGPLNELIQWTHSVYLGLDKKPGI